MDNREICSLLNEMADAYEYLDDPFRARAYRKAAMAVEGLTVPLGRLLAEDSLTAVQGIGKGISSTLASWEQGDFSAFDELSGQLPSGLHELLKIPGLGMKRIRNLKQKGIETIEDLSNALDDGRLSDFRGLTPRFSIRVKRAISDIIESRGKVLLNRAFENAKYISEILSVNGLDSCLTGELRRIQETIGLIDLIIAETANVPNKLKQIFNDRVHLAGEMPVIRMKNSPDIRVNLADNNSLAVGLFTTTGSQGHVRAVMEHASTIGYKIGGRCISKSDSIIYPESEGAFYGMLGMSYIPPEIREGLDEVDLSLSGSLPDLIDEKDIIGTIHNHTTYSDGRSSLCEMTEGAGNLGYRWIGIADHSVSAHYANGMDNNTVKKQHAQIDELNRTGVMKILKGIECDIMPDGSLDYSEEILKSFDYIIASIHTLMDMDKSSMTDRIIKAIRNPLTSMLAHPTGRLLLSRGPYEVDIDAVLDECLTNKVIVEINANPQRLDLSWEMAAGFAGAGGMLAISPDAHDTEGLTDMRYGIMVARKARIRPASLVNCFDYQEAAGFLKKNR